MNKILLAGVLILIVLGGGIFFLTRGKTAIPSSLTPSNSTAPQGNMVARSLKDLFLSGVSQKCTYNINETDNTGSGTTFMSGGKMRADITSTVENKTTNTHVIFADKVSYLWMDDQKNGYKMAFDPTAFAADTSGTAGPSGSKQPVDLNKPIPYNCSSSRVDATLFVPPSDVTFTDFSSMMPTGAKMPTGNQIKDSCSVCQSLSAEAKSQCLQALNCQ